MSALSGSSTSKPYVVEVLSEPAEFQADEGRFRIVSDDQTDDFLEWLRIRHYSVSAAHETSMLQVADEFALELMLRWA